MSNKTMLVPVVHNSETVTNFSNKQESYSSFKEQTIAKPRVRERNKESQYGSSENAYLHFSAEVIKQINEIQNSYNNGSVAEVKSSLVEEIDYFTQACLKEGLENASVMLSRYILCAYCDEMIGTTYWGKDNNWAHSSLLSHFYNETYGGDKFFQILDQLLRAPAKYFDTLELMYIFLSLGFEGKYRIQNRGNMELDAIKDSLFKQMKMMQIRETRSFYSNQKTSTERNTFIYKTSYQILIASITLMLGLIYGVLTYSLMVKEDKSVEMFSKQLNTYDAQSVKMEKN